MRMKPTEEQRQLMLDNSALRARVADMEAALRAVRHESIVTQSWEKLAPKIRLIVEAAGC